MFFQNHDRADGAIDQSCGGAGGGISNLPVWTYSAQQPVQSFSMPSGIGMNVVQGQKAYVQMHYFNAGDSAIARASVATSVLSFASVPSGAISPWTQMPAIR